MLLRVGVHDLPTVLQAHHDLDLVRRQHLGTGAATAHVRLLDNAAVRLLHGRGLRHHHLLVPFLILVEVLLNLQLQIHRPDHVLHLVEGAGQLLLQVAPCGAALEEGVPHLLLLVGQPNHHVDCVGDAVVGHVRLRRRLHGLLLIPDLQNVLRQLAADARRAREARDHRRELLLPVEARDRGEGLGLRGTPKSGGGERHREEAAPAGGRHRRRHCNEWREDRWPGSGRTVQSSLAT
mmetsp:Transcript_35222/g.104650  ORF Transcript_35222/g.104650 Transcript_35222/m.104650 type:complete len:236 (+) Transcript_35222:773-1480(+)